MSPNRIVALLTPLVFAPAAGTISALAAKYFPGVDLPASKVEEVFIAGALIALAKAAQWTQGWQKYEAREASRERAAELLDAREAAIAAREAEFAAAGGGVITDYGDGYGDDAYEEVYAGDELIPRDDDLDGDEYAGDDEPAIERAER